MGGDRDNKKKDMLHDNNKNHNNNINSNNNKNNNNNKNINNYNNNNSNKRSLSEDLTGRIKALGQKEDGETPTKENVFFLGRRYNRLLQQQQQQQQEEEEKEEEGQQQQQQYEFGSEYYWMRQKERFLDVEHSCSSCSRFFSLLDEKYRKNNSNHNS